MGLRGMQNGSGRNAMPVNHKTQRRWIGMSIIVCGLIACSPTRANDWPTTGILRGNVILSLRWPITQRAIEGLDLDKEHVAARSFEPVNNATIIHRVIVPPELWTALEDLRQEWCAHPPRYARVTRDPSAFEVTLKCDGTTPVYTIPPESLPDVLHTLTNLIPPTPLP